MKAVQPEFAPDKGRFFKVHPGFASCRHQFHKRPATFGDDDLLAACRGARGLGEASFRVSDR